MNGDTRSLRAAFVETANDRVAETEAAILRWENDAGDQGALAEMRRALHSLKGTAGTCGNAPVAVLAHGLESYLERAVRAGGDADRVVRLTLTACDHLRTLIGAAEDEHHIVDEATGELLAAFTAEAARLRRAGVPAAGAARPNGTEHDEEPRDAMSEELHRQAFKDEAHERLAELEEALLSWEQHRDDPGLVDRIFRAVHTIKGSGAMFGFDEIAVFAHELEAVFDAVRGGRLAPDPGLVDIVLAARDHIQAMVQAEEGGEPPDPERTRLLEAALREYARQAEGAAGGGNGEAPPPAEEMPAAAPAREATYRIRFRPHPDLFRHGSDPLLLLRDLRGLGMASVTMLLDAVPPLAEMEPEHCYAYWDIVLTTSRGEDAIRDVFIFVADECDLEIEKIEAPGPDEPAGEETHRLGEILLARHDLSTDALSDALGQRPPLGESLVTRGAVTPDKVGSALSEQMHLRQAAGGAQVSPGSIRVASGRLDDLVNLVSEMVTAQARLSQLATRDVNAELTSVAEEMERLTGDLRERAMTLRMVPIAVLFDKFRRVVRDLSRELDKQVDVHIEGAETELDKTVIERLGDPLVHLVRNAVDHGIESPAQRQAAGKSPRGTIRLQAEHAGAEVVVHIRDDGAGLDAAAIREKAVRLGLVRPEAELSEAEIHDLVFAPGFSTTEAVTEVSGRGVGMDVVKRNIEALRGSVEVASEAGAGTRFTLHLPLTLAIIDGLLVQVSDEAYVIALSSILECVEIGAEDLKRAHGERMLTLRGELVPYVSLRRRFDLEGERPPVEQVVVCQAGAQRVGLTVDRIVGHHQTVIKPLGRMFRNVGDVSGATVLGDGTVALILDIASILRALDGEQTLPGAVEAPYELTEGAGPSALA